MDKEFMKPTSLDPNEVGGDYYLRKAINGLNDVKAAAAKALSQAFGVVRFMGLIDYIPSSWTHVSDASGVSSTDSGSQVCYDTVNNRMMLLKIADGQVTYYTHWSDADNFGVSEGAWGSVRSFKPFEHRIYSSGRVLYVFDGEQMIAFADLTDPALHQAAFDAASVQTFNDLWVAMGGTIRLDGVYLDPDGTAIGNKNTSHTPAVKYFIDHVKNLLSQEEIDSMKADIGNLKSGSGAMAIKFAGMKDPEITPLVATAPGNALTATFDCDVFYSPTLGQFYLEKREPDMLQVGGAPIRGEVIACYASWPYKSDGITMDYFGTKVNGKLVPFAERIYVDADGRLFTGHAQKLVSGVGTSSLDNIRAEVNASTGMLNISNASGTKSLSTGTGNFIGSDNVILSNATIWDRAQLNAFVYSYPNTGLLSIRHVVDDSAYSNMEHLSIGGCNVIGSNNTLASNINIGDGTLIGAGIHIGVPEEPGYITFIGQGVYIDEGASIDRNSHVGENVNIPDNFKVAYKTQAQYDALATKDPNTLYFIIES